MLYEYPGFQNCYSKCELEIVRSSGKTTLVICTELPDNPGTSVTNCAAALATRVCQEDETIDPESLLWVEHYPEQVCGLGNPPFPASWDMVIFTEREGTTFRNPSWYSLKPEEMQHIRERIAGGGEWSILP